MNYSMVRYVLLRLLGVMGALMVLPLVVALIYSESLALVIATYRIRRSSSRSSLVVSCLPGTTLSFAPIIKTVFHS